MKCIIPEISWHNRDPVLSVDIQPKSELFSGDNKLRLASGGTDSHVLIWYMSWNEHGSIDLELAADLSRHQRAVNAVKWSPNGKFLASGDDESVVFIWKLKEKNETVNILDDTNTQDKEIWINLKILRGHLEDIYDLSWSPDSQYLVSGSVDNTALIWDIQKGRSIAMLRDHKSFVQGVAWDPKNEFIATLSTDRNMRIFDIKTKKCVSRVNKCILPVPECSELFDKSVRIFHDDTLQTFFRRLCFSPDGNLIITPSGITDCDGVNKRINATYIFTRYSLKQPAVILPSPDEYTVAVKCCPQFFKLHENGPEPVIDLPYRIIFAVATKSSVYLYDTQQKIPFGVVSNIHYTRLSDLTWSSDGRILIISSTDGFCSIITFEENELGCVFNTESLDKTTPRKNNGIKENKKSPKTESNQSQVEPKQSEIGIQKLDFKKINAITPNKGINLTDKTIEESSANKITNFSKLQNFIIDKEVLSVDEKFHSPCSKKSRQPTPIAVRRTPRVLTENNMGQSPSTTQKIDNDNKKSRRQLTDTTTITEEAREAWPVPIEAMEVDDDKIQNHEKNSKLDPSAVIEISEDIQLVMEDTQN
ncbi:chromatin assembly factor 1 subunit B [Condylostylus longicornis]|uniref:chromatin assembly factor 1 subunit B n=1 Tax=Condylostylus longicornis TaxID=2530218 RepID=UPI00244E4329|nr:chromatin assembly factor 1 subunit B [Condylostylus longicornis]